ncbi:Reverse transcriptase RNA-dependent DNA polymerase [Trinorchestia longiramus]|nr:Reverse transcriptase RNA-dependent DNA polymerase [Trinorchestia longiramus]
MADSNSGKSCMKPLNERNYPTWKIHMRMCLVKYKLWDIVLGTETISSTADEAARRKFESHRDLALATIVLGVDQSQLYLLGDPTDPVEVWRKLQNTFQKKSWVNKFRLKKKLFNMKLENGQNLQDHLKVCVELFEELAIIGNAMEEEERVIILLSSLPDRFSTLVTALEAHEKIPAWELVTERLLNEERRQRGGPGTSDSSEKLLEPSKEIECVPWSFPQEEKHEDSEGELELRRSTRKRAAPDRFGEWVCFAQDKFDVPANEEEALHGPESKLWKAAMEEEMASMNINNVWSLVECPKNKKPIRCKWIFEKKTGPDGNVCSYKARLVAQGYAQKFGVDYDGTFSPVVAFCTKEIDFVCCPSNDMLADIFTKGLSAEKFSRLRRKLGVVFFEKHIQCEKEC